MFEGIGFRDSAVNDQMSATVAEQLSRWIPGGEYQGWVVEPPEGQVVAGIGLSIAQLSGSPRNLSGRPHTS